MTDKIENPLAFPSPACGDWSPEYGMSLRDWFAGQAMNNSAVGGLKPAETARRAYAIADAMLAERARGQS